MFQNFYVTLSWIKNILLFIWLLNEVIHQYPIKNLFYTLKQNVDVLVILIHSIIKFLYKLEVQ